MVHDEDSDQVDDACDNCPAIPNGGQSNTDGDGVGNLCEYQKDQTRLLRIQHFEPFVAQPADFLFGSHASMGTDEVLIQTELCGLGCSDMAFWNQPLSGTYSVETSFTYEALSFGYVGTAFARKQDGWWACLLSRPGTSTTRYLALWHYPGSGAIQKMAEVSGVESGTVPASAKRRITVHVSPTEAFCRFDNDEGGVAQVSAAPPSGTDFSGRAGMRVYEANARYQSFVVYSP